MAPHDPANLQEKAFSKSKAVLNSKLESQRSDKASKLARDMQRKSGAVQMLPEDDGGSVEVSASVEGAVGPVELGKNTLIVQVIIHTVLVFWAVSISKREASLTHPPRLRTFRRSTRSLACSCRTNCGFRTRFSKVWTEIDRLVHGNALTFATHRADLANARHDDCVSLQSRFLHASDEKYGRRYNRDPAERPRALPQD
eukprot:scaffold7340_cov266-Pinguiococcus_pyrenoidosus.AAC.7